MAFTLKNNFITHHFNLIVSDKKLLTINAELYLKENKKSYTF
jgi:hypothetical protein